MFSLTTTLLLLSIVSVNCIQIPFIENVTLIPRYIWNSTTITNTTCEQCLCMSIPSFAALNCFSNNTCQLFYTFPITYKIQSTPSARLYFPQQIFPNASQCCMPDLGYLLDKLNNGTWTYVNINRSRNLALDDDGYVVTVEMSPPKLDRFDAQSLTLIDQTTINGSTGMVVGFANNTYFVGLVDGTIVVISNANLTTLTSFTSTFTSGIRGIISLDNGRTIVVTSFDDQTIVFFRQTGNASLNYTFAYQQQVDYTGIHGLTGYNNSYFYTTSWNSKSVYSYSAVANSTSWIETLVINPNMVPNGGFGAFATIDECGRYWFSLYIPVVQVFDHLGLLVGNFSLGSGSIFDILITDNYVMYFSDDNNDESRIIRIDPHIQC